MNLCFWIHANEHFKWQLERRVAHYSLNCQLSLIFERLLHCTLWSFCLIGVSNIVFCHYTFWFLESKLQHRNEGVHIDIRFLFLGLAAIQLFFTLPTLTFRFTTFISNLIVIIKNEMLDSWIILLLGERRLWIGVCAFVFGKKFLS